MAAGSLQTPSPCVFHHIWSSAARLGYPYAVPEAANQSYLFTRALVCASAWMQQLLRSCRDLSSWLTKRSSRTAMATTNMLQQLWPGVPGVENGGAQMEGRGLRQGCRPATPRRLRTAASQPGRGERWPAELRITIDHTKRTS